MSHIELKLVADTAADLSGLIAGLQAQMGAAAPIVIAAEDRKPAKKGKAEKSETDADGTGSTTTTEAAAAISAETKTEAAPASAASDDTPAVEYADVQAATTALAAAKGRDAAIGCLAEFDVKNGKDLREDQWAAYVARAKEIAEG